MVPEESSLVKESVMVELDELVVTAVSVELILKHSAIETFFLAENDHVCVRSLWLKPLAQDHSNCLWSVWFAEGVGVSLVVT